MNKYIEKVEKYKEKTLVPVLEKMKADYAIAEDFFTDTGYDRYYNKMLRCEKQIDEIEKYLSPAPAVKDITTDQYREFLDLKKTMQSVKSNLFYLMDDLPDCSEKARLRDALREIEDYQLNSGGSSC